ncbi:MAG TPA: GvpL/GvpF family gas vesicle protein [Enteractinococcus helveticum]|uniref:GvpL/GvpF family gas vesicle protein n=1 Tax=Enteractinococcus helveticum TaxID=1837282 RepID=A0A921FLH0_9MICC|nr:GvpL/GvpF family gas vesicle protein [Enteractinococcus helveticum]HJF14385.1 GvpL/GvpF family gas vesicle protein [Enteractinococcus helveticum]
MTTEAEHDQLYVYGIVTENTTLPAGLTGVSQGAVNTTTHGPLAAVVTHLNDEDELGTPDNLLAHSTVLDAIAEHLTILPMAFGTVAPSEAELREAILGLNEAEYLEALKRLSDSVQYTVRARYIRDAVLADLIEDDPQVAKLRETIAGTTEDETRAERIALGELVVEAFGSIRPVHAQHIIDAVSPTVEDIQEHEGGQVEDVVEMAVLVNRERVSEFEAALEVVAQQLHTRINFQLNGPQAPYDFVVE